MAAPKESSSFAALRRLFDSRIAVLDGAMGTMIQGHELEEADFRGKRFARHPRDLKGNNDLLSLTRPDVIEGIHSQYFAAGADIVETNTFNSTVISQADYGTEAVVAEMNAAAVAAARRAAEKAEAAEPSRPRFVAGAIGPLNRTLSMSPDVNRPDFRAVNWDQVVNAYLEQARVARERRGGRAPHRDDIRHPEREGRALRDRAPFRRDRRPAARHALGHDHGRLGHGRCPARRSAHSTRASPMRSRSRSASTAPWAAGR